MGRRARSQERTTFSSQAFNDREELPSGVWGCPSPLRIHPIANVPTIVFWNQPDYENPQPEDSLVWAVYVGWPDLDIGSETYGKNWRYYRIPNPTGTPLENRLERPRIDLEYNNDLPAIVVGLDDGGLRYGTIHMGNIDLVTPNPAAADQWLREIVPLGDQYPPVADRLDYPDLVFTGDDIILVSAVGYHSTKDDLPNERPYEVLMLARKRSDGSWRSQRATRSLCPSADPSVSRMFLIERTPFDSPPIQSGKVALCPEPYLSYIPAYPSLVPGPTVESETTTRLVFTFGKQAINPGSYKNYLYSLDFKNSLVYIEASGSLPLAWKQLLNENTTYDFLQDFVYSGVSRSGELIMSLDEIYDPYQGFEVDATQLLQFQIDAWLLQLPSQHYASIAMYDYNRMTNWRWWLPGTLAEIPPTNDYAYLTPYHNNWIIADSEEGATLSFFSSTGSSSCGYGGDQYCPETIIENDSGEYSYESSLAFGAFPQLGRDDEALVAYHVTYFDPTPGIMVGEIVISPQNNPLPTTVYGDFNFDGTAGGSDDKDIFCDAFIASMGQDGVWTNNPLCDYDIYGEIDGDVDCDDLAQFESVYFDPPVDCTIFPCE